MRGKGCFAQVFLLFSKIYYNVSLLLIMMRSINIMYKIIICYLLLIEADTVVVLVSVSLPWAIHVTTMSQPARHSQLSRTKQRISNLFLPKFWTILTKHNIRIWSPLNRVSVLLKCSLSWTIVFYAKIERKIYLPSLFKWSVFIR